MMTVNYRFAVFEDIPQLVDLENKTFTSDRLSTRQFRYLIKRETAIVLVADKDQQIGGYGILLIRQSTAMGRLYSLAVATSMQGHGIGNELLARLEQAATDHHKYIMRLEVRTDNPARHLYQRRGYRPLSIINDYYEDHSDAMRMEKRLGRHPKKRVITLPYYKQTTEFTCGPASLMMALAALDPHIVPSPFLELQLWREATTIYMTAGHGGCGPRGLALAAARRAFNVQLLISQPGPLFLEGVRSAHKKEVLTLVYHDFERQLASQHIAPVIGAIDWPYVANAVNTGSMAVVLISSYRLVRSKAPHWVVVGAFEDGLVYIHDPDEVDDELGIQDENIFIPIAESEFIKMAQYGAHHLSAVVLVNT